MRSVNSEHFHSGVLPNSHLQVKDYILVAARKTAVITIDNICMQLLQPSCWRLSLLRVQTQDLTLVKWEGARSPLLETSNYQYQSFTRTFAFLAPDWLFPVQPLAMKASDGMHCCMLQLKIKLYMDCNQFKIKHPISIELVIQHFSGNLCTVYHSETMCKSILHHTFLFFFQETYIRIVIS